MERMTLKKARIIAGLTQQEVADKLGISTPTYRNLERNPERLTLKQAMQLSEILGQPLDVLFFYASA